MGLNWSGIKSHINILVTPFLLLTSMSVLPTELLHLIIAKVADGDNLSTLAACSLANRWLLAPSQRVLFQAIDLTDLDTFIALLAVSPHLAGYITSLKLRVSTLSCSELPDILAFMSNVHCLTMNGSRNEWHRQISWKLFTALKSFIFPSLTHIHLLRLLGIPFSEFALPHLRHMTLDSSTSVREKSLIPDDVPRHGLHTLLWRNYSFEDVKKDESLLTFLAHSTGKLESLIFRGGAMESVESVGTFISLYKHSLKDFDVGGLLCRSSCILIRKPLSNKAFRLR